jgi:predicted MFS family arabinose efflux permease
MPPQRSAVDARWILTAQAGRAFGYGLAAALLGATLAASGLTPTQAGLVLTAVVAGTVVASLLVGVLADRWGRRRTYLVLYVALAATGVVYASTSRWPVLAAVALLGVLSTEVVESGPFTTAEQAMLATTAPGQKPMVSGFGRYNAVAAAAGSLGALAAAVPHLLRRALPTAPADQRYFLALTVVALLGGYAAARLSVAVEAEPAPPAEPAPGPTARTAPVVWRLAGLFAVDSFGGGFVVQAFLVYWLQHRYGASTTLAGVVMFAVGLLQTASFLAAPRIAHRVGLLPTMVFTHLPSNLLLAALAFAPTLTTAVGLLLARTALSQMDVPTRQAYVMTLVPAGQRTRAAAVTNTARYLTRPAGTALLGPVQFLAPGLPFLLAGAIKTGYDLTLWTWFRHVRLPEPVPAATPPGGNS